MAQSKSSKYQEEEKDSLEEMGLMKIPFTYLNLIICKCLGGEETIFVEDGWPWRKMCEKCHHGWGKFSPNFKEKTKWHPLCSYLEGLPIELKVKCAICKRKIIK